MNTCFKKGEKSYRFAIKNSLIQIGQKAIQEYLDKISAQMLQNYDYINYLILQFEPNFTDYIAYCFERLTDIYEQIGIKNEELNRLNNYLDLHHVNRNVNQDMNLHIIYCMVCKNIPNNPYKCKGCESEVCENCYLEEENFACINCDGEDFIKKDNNYGQEVEKTENENNINLNLIDDNNNENYSNKNIIHEEKKLSKSNCMICQKSPNVPYKCTGCEYKVCEMCYLNKLEDEENEYEYICENCGQKEFEKVEDEEGNKNEIKYNDEKSEKEENNETNNNQDYKGDIDLAQNFINDSADFNNYLKTLENEEGKKLSKTICMRCNNPPIELLKCVNCGYTICNSCYLNLLGSQGTYRCENCNYDEFGLNSKENEGQKENEDKNNEDKDNKDNYSRILNNKLKIQSIDAIKKYRDEFKNELLEIFNPKFDEFVKEAANNIYIKVAEKYFDIANNKNFQMKKRDELNAEAIKELNSTLKEKAQENFLSKFASQLFQDIILIFKKKCEEKLGIFINDLLNNKQANDFFKDCDALNENKKLIFENELNEYIESLRKKETESLKRALSASDKSLGNNLGESCSSGCSGSCPSESQGFS